MTPAFVPMKNNRARPSSLLGRNLAKRSHFSLPSQRGRSLTYESRPKKMNPLKVTDFKAQLSKQEENASNLCFRSLNSLVFAGPGEFLTNLNSLF